MEVRVIALTNNHYIISQVDEVATEDIGQPDCKLVKPYVVNTCLLYTSPSPRDS